MKAKEEEKRGIINVRKKESRKALKGKRFRELVFPSVKYYNLDYFKNQII